MRCAPAKTFLRLLSTLLIAAVTFPAGAGSPGASQAPMITDSGQQITSIFDGIAPSQQLRDSLVLKAVPLGAQSLPKSSSPNIGKILGVPAAAATGCPTSGICANPGTTGTFGMLCEDPQGCSVDVHNQAPGEPDQGVLELYDCEQCCVDWYPCTIETGGGTPGCNDDPTKCIDPGLPGPSPIIVDTEGEGFHLTSASNGVQFDIAGNGAAIQMGWTDAHFHNAFLALPGADGLVHNGKELFGNFTPQPKSDHPNGFIALAQYDLPVNGGNGDGIIDEHDAVYSKLRLWIDENHDGVCQPNELHGLPELGVYSLALKYRESRRTDEWGNQFRYQAQVNPGEHKDPRDQSATGEPGRWTYDVFFVTK